MNKFVTEMHAGMTWKFPMEVRRAPPQDDGRALYWVATSGIDNALGGTPNEAAAKLVAYMWAKEAAKK